MRRSLDLREIDRAGRTLISKGYKCTLEHESQLFRDTYAKCEPPDATRDNDERTHEYSCL